MLSAKRDYPQAVAAGPERGDLGTATAILWALEIRKTVGGTALAYAPGMRNIRDNDMLSKFTQQSGVVLGTWKKIATWQGGPVVAAWPDREHLAEIADDRRTLGLVLLPWNKGEHDGWIHAINPQRLDGALEPDPSASPDVLDPVVVAGLRTLTAMVNQANNLAGSMDRRDAVAVLRTLYNAGYPLPPEPVYAWAIRSRWNGRGAVRLRELAEAYMQGKRPQLKGTFPLSADILDRWKADVDDSVQQSDGLSAPSLDAANPDQR
jgi:hypothetical protein